MPSCASLWSIAFPWTALRGSNVPHLTAIAVLMGFSALMGRRTHRMVDAQLVQTNAESAPGAVVGES
jgi:hypothetical protein